MFTRKPASEPVAHVSNPLPSPRIATPSAVPPPSPVTAAQETADPLKEDGWVVIGKGTHVQGKIGDCRRLEVHGILEADVVADLLVVRAGGGIKGVVQCDDAKLHGVFEGNLVVHNHLEIESTGHVTGDVSYRTLAIQAGARLRGNIVCSQPEDEEVAQSEPGNVISFQGMFNGEADEHEGSGSDFANGYANGYANGATT